MGKKYIIEIEDGKEGIILCQKGIVTVGLHLENESELKPLGIQSAIPYTEPDLEQVRKEGYEQGQEDLRKSCVPKDEEAYGIGYNEGFQCGLDLAWEAARKIIHMPEGDLLNIFTECYSAVCTALQVVLKYDASECIEKIQAYEQEEIKVGDEVELKCGVRPAIYMQGTKGSDEIYLLFNDGSCGLHSKSEIVRKTGRHFHEIATILENMRGEQDG